MELLLFAIIIIEPGKHDNLSEYKPSLIKFCIKTNIRDISDDFENQLDLMIIYGVIAHCSNNNYWTL